MALERPPTHSSKRPVALRQRWPLKYFDKRNKYRKNPAGPLFGLWTWKYLDKLRTVRLVTSKRVMGFYKVFVNTYPPGTEFPRIQLRTVDGETVDTGKFRGEKHFVLFTGAIT